MKTKPLAAITALLAVALVAGLCPILFLAASPSLGACRSAASGGDVAAIAATIRHLESGDDYTARAPGSSASGAYQFLDSTWDGYRGYARAYLAPPEVQDAKAVEGITKVLEGNGGDPAVVPVAWYIGHVPAPGSPEWDTVPAPGAGNRLTPREYQTRWMETYRQKVAESTTGTSAPSGSTPPTSSPSACAPGSATISGDYALPVDRHWYDEHPDWFTKPHHDYPAADLPVPTGTPIYSMTSGVVIALTTAGDCGIGVIINGDDGAQYTFCHGLPGSHEVAAGGHVSVGAQIMLSASTGNSTGPHLHVGIVVDRRARCPQPLFAGVAKATLPPTVDALPERGCYS